MKDKVNNKTYRENMSLIELKRITKRENNILKI